MGKRHKKNKAEKKNIKEQQIKICQETLSEDKDMQAMERPEMEADSDKEQRRTTRLGAIITIIAVIGTLCVFLFNMTVNMLSIWSERGIIYLYLQALFSLSLSIVLLIAYDIVWYLIYDLNRYNVVAPNYKQYDAISDRNYERLIIDFKIYMFLLALMVLLIIPVSIFYTEGIERYASVLGTCGLGVVLIFFLARWIKQNSKEKRKDTYCNILVKIGIWILTEICCLTIAITFVKNTGAMLTVNYNTNGIMEICNTSAGNYNGLDIEIYDIDDEMVYTESVEKEELLLAREVKYISNEVNEKKVDEGIILNSEWLHWKYIFDLNQVENMEEAGYIVIKVNQNGKQAWVINSYRINGTGYVFAKDNMKKDY